MPKGVILICARGLTISRSMTVSGLSRTCASATVIDAWGISSIRPSSLALSWRCASITDVDSAEALVSYQAAKRAYKASLKS